MQQHFLKEYIEDYKFRVVSMDILKKKPDTDSMKAMDEIQKQRLSLEILEEEQKAKKSKKLLHDIVHRTQMQKSMMTNGELQTVVAINSKDEKLITSPKKKEVSPEQPKPQKLQLKKLPSIRHSSVQPCLKTSYEKQEFDLEPLQTITINNKTRDVDFINFKKEHQLPIGHFKDFIYQTKHGPKNIYRNEIKAKLKECQTRIDKLRLGKDGVEKISDKFLQQ